MPTESSPSLSPPLTFSVLAMVGSTDGGVGEGGPHLAVLVGLGVLAEMGTQVDGVGAEFVGACHAALSCICHDRAASCHRMTSEPPCSKKKKQ